MSKKIKIFFVLPTLYAGGAERVISFVSQNLDKEKFDSKLIVIGFEKDSKYAVSGIPVVFLNKKRVLNGAFALFKILLKQKPPEQLSPRGNQGFGYDTLFQPENESRTFAEMTLSEKNVIAHRARALHKFKTFADENLKFADE